MAQNPKARETAAKVMEARRKLLVATDELKRLKQDVLDAEMEHRLALNDKKNWR